MEYRSGYCLYINRLIDDKSNTTAARGGIDGVPTCSYDEAMNL